MPLEINKIKFNKEKVGFCRFKKLKGKYLVTNDIGRYVFLTPREFKEFMEGKLDEKSKIFKELEEKEFIRDRLDLEHMIYRYGLRKNFIFQGPSLHIVVVTLRCNHRCVYCQTSSRGMEEKGYDMDIETARKVVDTIFKTPSKAITIEFQGGEPLVNWPVVKFIVEYAREKNKKIKKNLLISLVSNFSLLTDERYNFLAKNYVALCTSLDGPEELHNKNRPWPGGNSYKITTKWIKKITKFQEKFNLFRVSALVTISRDSLKYPKEIVDEYLKWKFRGIHLRPLSFLGLSGKMKDKIGYSADEFMRFWRKAMDYIININLKGKFFFERGSRIMLTKILSDKDPNFLDLRSPCGAGIGQLVYNFDGKVYTCDEGRMVGDDTFCIGNVKKNSYKDIVFHDTVKTLCMASLLENLPCDNCVYQSYCGVCPVSNYALFGTLFPQLPNIDMCKLHKGMLDYLFERLENKRVKKVFDKWIKTKRVKS
ncbi:MAG: His-Xaa-Ser system radical SAM maturase HxsB [Candidatus Nealsonbacteria bacterium]|nr:MAG: His-Xaa-Ser system radical SAM maturase HxsB [Candidatus Nealsonbacteria bacterium]